MAWSDGSIAGEPILKLADPFTLATVFDFQHALRSNHPPVTIVDLTAVPYMDSAALGSLMGLHVSCRQHDRHYALSGVHSILARSSSLAEAEAALGGRAAAA